LFKSSSLCAAQSPSNDLLSYRMPTCKYCSWFHTQAPIADNGHAPPLHGHGPHHLVHFCLMLSSILSAIYRIVYGHPVTEHRPTVTLGSTRSAQDGNRVELPISGVSLTTFFSDLKVDAASVLANSNLPTCPPPQSLHHTFLCRLASSCLKTMVQQCLQLSCQWWTSKEERPAKNTS
jgi:hypothetical protein